MHEWCVANNRLVTCKQDYFEVIKSMGDGGYMFGMIRNVGVYVDVCALFSDGRAGARVAESDLRFIDG